MAKGNGIKTWMRKAFKSGNMKALENQPKFILEKLKEECEKAVPIKAEKVKKND